MKKNYKNKFLCMSLVAAMLLGSSAYAGKIIGVTAGTPHILTEPYPTQYGFGGWNFDNVVVRMINAETDELSGLTFNESNGTYDTMTYGDSFSSDITVTSGDIIMATLGGKDWPVGEPAGIKIVNDDFGTINSGKSPNCIMTTSYLDEVDSGTGESGYLDIYETSTRDNPIAVPTVCSSPFQSHKRFKVRMLETTVTSGVYGVYGDPIDLVFNLDTNDSSAEKRRYQVFSKINNYTGVRLDGYKVELLDENGTKTTPDNQIKFSLDLTTKTTSDDESGYEAVFAHGLWGPIDKHFSENGFFDGVRAGFFQEGNNTQVLIGGAPTLGNLGSNYADIFGNWLPSKWAPYGIFFDNDNDPTTDSELIAFWGTEPNAEPGTLPAWHYGKDYDLSDGDQSWAEPRIEELLTWATNPLYSLGKIEDTLNLGLNYVVEVGLNSTIGKKFTIRITPHVATEANQTAPGYIMDDNETYIMPPTDYNSKTAVLVISPAPTFVPDEDLRVSLADIDLNTDDATVQNITVVVKNSTGDEENVLLVETDFNSSIFTGILSTNTVNVGGINDGTMTAVDGTVVTAYYTDESEDMIITASTTAISSVTPPANDDENPRSGGGGCTYNPNSKNFDMTFLLLIVLGLLYPFRRRFV